MIGRFLLGTGLGSLVGTGIVVMVAMLAPVKSPYAPVAGVGPLVGEKAEEVPAAEPAPVELPVPEVVAEAPAAPRLQPGATAPVEAVAAAAVELPVAPQPVSEPASEPAPGSAPATAAPAPVVAEAVTPPQAAAPVAEAAPVVPEVATPAEAPVEMAEAPAAPLPEPAPEPAVEPAPEPAPVTALLAAAQEPAGLVSPMMSEFALQAPVEATAGLRTAEGVPSQPLVPASEAAPAHSEAPEAPAVVVPAEAQVAEAPALTEPAPVPAAEPAPTTAPAPTAEAAPAARVAAPTDEFVVLPEGIPATETAEATAAEDATAEAPAAVPPEPPAEEPAVATAEAVEAPAEPAAEAPVATAPVTPDGAETPVAEAAAPASSLPGQAASAMPETASAGTVRRIAPGGGSTLTTATAQPGLGGGSGRALPRIGDTEPAAGATASADARPLSAFARPFDNTAAKPLFAVILIDDGSSSIDRTALAALPFPVSFAVDPLAPDASSRAEAYRAAGQEVLILASGLPKGAQASDVEVAFQAMDQTLPEAVAVMDLADRRFQADRPLASLVVPVIAAQGRGLVTWEGGGLNAANQVAQREAVPATVAFRNLDADAENEATIRRYLDRAAFKAAQEGRVTVVGHTRPETIAALLAWSIEGRAATVALAPVSAVLAD